MTLAEARNEIKVREDEIAKIDVQIEALQKKIAERQEDWDFERKQREQDPNWRIAALDYIQKGDRSGLESYTTNRLMAEQSLVDRINSFDIEKSNLIRDERQVMNALDQVGIALKRTNLDANERVTLETKQKDLQSQLDAIRDMKSHTDAKKQSAQEFYERRYGKSRYSRKFPTSVEPKEEPKVETKVETKVDEQPGDESVESKLNHYSALVNDYVAKIPTSYDLTDEDVNEWKDAIRDEMKANGVPSKDINELLSNVKGNGLSRLQAFKNNFDWVKNINTLKFNGDPSEAAKKSFLKKLESNEMFKKLSTNDQRILTDEVNGIESSGSKGRAGAQGAARNDSITQAQEWKNNKDSWLKTLNRLIGKTSESARKEHEALWNTISGNPYAIKQLEKLHNIKWNGYFFEKVNPEHKPSNPSTGTKKADF